MVADIVAAFALLCAREDVDAGRVGVVGHCWGGSSSVAGGLPHPSVSRLRGVLWRAGEAVNGQEHYATNQAGA